MKTLIIWCMMAGAALAQDAKMKAHLENVYGIWRNSMIQRDYPAWVKITAAHRQVIVQNRLNSERRVFPKAIFEVPAAPPALNTLKNLQSKFNGRTAKFVYFGKIDFGVGGDPTENLLIVDFVQETTGWKYDKSEFVSLAALPDVRAELQACNLSYIEKTPEFAPTGIVPPVTMPVPVAKYISKVYVFCPGRSVDVTVNKISQHRFGNAKDAELIMGGVRDGDNEISYSIKGLPGGTGKEALAIRVYVFSQVEGVQPIKAFEYLVQEGAALQGAGRHVFPLDAAMSAKLLGK